MKYKLAILTHEQFENAPAKSKILNIIKPFNAKDQALYVADVLKDHIFDDDVVVVWEEPSGDVHFMYDPAKKNTYIKEENNE